MLAFMFVIKVRKAQLLFYFRNIHQKVPFFKKNDYLLNKSDNYKQFTKVRNLMSVMVVPSIQTSFNKPDNNTNCPLKYTYVCPLPFTIKHAYTVWFYCEHMESNYFLISHTKTFRKKYYINFNA